METEGSRVSCRSLILLRLLTMLQARFTKSRRVTAMDDKRTTNRRPDLTACRNVDGSSWSCNEDAQIFAGQVGRSVNDVPGDGLPRIFDEYPISLLPGLFVTSKRYSEATRRVDPLRVQASTRGRLGGKVSRVDHVCISYMSTSPGNSHIDPVVLEQNLYGHAP